MSKNSSDKQYLIGFIFSILLTFSSYFAVTNKLFTGISLTAFVIVLAFTQLVVQLIFFLHLGRESKPRWNLVFLLSTASIILIVIVGSLWIMGNLNYHLTPSDINNYIIQDEGIHH